MNPFRTVPGALAWYPTGMLKLLFSKESSFLGKIFRARTFGYFCWEFWFRSTMDSISDSDSEDAGSIPAGTTNKADPEATDSLQFAGGLL